jgi:hypothetical protein
MLVIFKERFGRSWEKANLILEPDGDKSVKCFSGDICRVAQCDGRNRD